MDNHCSQVGKIHTQAPRSLPKAVEKPTREISSDREADWVAMEDFAKEVTFMLICDCHKEASYVWFRDVKPNRNCIIVKVEKTNFV